MVGSNVCSCLIMVLSLFRSSLIRFSSLRIIASGAGEEILFLKSSQVAQKLTKFAAAMYQLTAQSRGAYSREQ